VNAELYAQHESDHSFRAVLIFFQHCVRHVP
jgi:hypothetical protein